MACLAISGSDFFVPAPSRPGAAASFVVNITDADQIAASGGGSIGGNIIRNSLIDLRNRALVNGDRLADAYSRLAFQVGSQLATVQSDLQGSESILQ